MADRVLRKFQRGKPVKFPLNDEVTSLAVAPSGRFVCAGFTDGTVRLFDLTGHFHNKQTSKKNVPGSSPLPSRGSVVDSKRHQRFGAVVCQIHAKGVHTSLRMHVELSEDGLWCFAGALRGSMELIAISLEDMQAMYDRYDAKEAQSDAARNGNSEGEGMTPNLLDHVTVHRHSDAKLRGFGACTRLEHSGRYLLFTGRSIKNIHIWSFDPPASPSHDPVLVQLYDTSTNGNTISFLQFRRHSTTGALQAISKSVDQRLRVWDLSAEQEGKYDRQPDQRPNRPPFQDVPNTEGTLAVTGGFCICGGSQMYNQMSLVSLNVDNLRSEYNHTEMALPGGAVSPPVGGASRRMQRGDLKNVVEAYGNVENANHVILEISDGTLGHYRKGVPQLCVMDKLPWYLSMSRTMTVGQLPGGWPVAIVALYQGTSGRGQLSIWPLETASQVQSAPSPPLEAPTVINIEKTNMPSTTPAKADERSLASTMATTPESQMSRQTEQRSIPSAESKGADSKASAMEEPKLGGDVPSTCVVSITNETESVAPAKLARRFSDEHEKMKSPTGTALEKHPKPVQSKDLMNRRPSNETSMSKSAGSMKVPRRMSGDSKVVGTNGAQKRAGRPSGESNIEALVSNKTARRYSNEAFATAKHASRRSTNERPHSAPAAFKVEARKNHAPKPIGISKSIDSKQKKPAAVRPSAPLLQKPVATIGLSKENNRREYLVNSPSSRNPATDASASKKEMKSENEQHTQLSSQTRSPPPEQPPNSHLIATAPKAGDKRPLITPTPTGKAGPNHAEIWQQFSIDSAAQTLSSLKRSPEVAKMVLDTPLVAYRRENTPAATDRSEMKQSSGTAEKDPLPAPRILHQFKAGCEVAERSQLQNGDVAPENQNRRSNPASTPPQIPKAPVVTHVASEESPCVTPAVGSKRKSDIATALAKTTLDQSPLDDDSFNESLLKRRKTDDLGWLRSNTSLPGRRDGEQMRRAIAKACSRQRQAIERKVNSLPSSRASGSLGELQKLLVEHKAACIFLEKRYVTGLSCLYPNNRMTTHIQLVNT